MPRRVPPGPGVVAPRGFEPRLTDSKSAVLPLDEGAAGRSVPALASRSSRPWRIDRVRRMSVVSLDIAGRTGRRFQVLAMASLLAACSSDAVPLLTGTGPFSGADHTCYLNRAVGTLVVDQTYGTAIVQEVGDGFPPFITPVMWWHGFSGRRAGSQVEVLDPEGTVVAVTGRRYSIGGGTWAETLTPTKENHYAFEGPRFWLACEVIPT